MILTIHPNARYAKLPLLPQPFYGLWTLSGTTHMSWYQKGKTRKVKTNLDLLEQEIVSGSGISWAICKSAPRLRQITKPASHHSVLTGGMPFLLPSQQHQSTEGMKIHRVMQSIYEQGTICLRVGNFDRQNLDYES